MNLPMLKGKPVIRCSSLDHIISCPGSRTLLEALGAVRADESESWEGSWCHFEAALRLVADHGAIPPEGGLVAPDIPADYQPSSMAKWMVDFYVRQVLDSAGAYKAIEVESELLHEFPRFWLSGHCDSNSVDAECIELDFDDLKTGINPVDPAECNWQIYGYAVLFKLQWPSLRRIRGRIIQPRITEDVGDKVTEMILEGDTLVAAPSFLEQQINAALDNPMLLRTGIKQCRWCDAWLKCASLGALKLEIDEMKQLLLTQELLKKMKEQPDDQALAQVVVARKLLNSKFESAVNLMKARLEKVKLITLEDGTRIFLEEKLGTREIVNMEKAWEVLADILPADVLYSLISMGVEPTEKALAKHFGIPHKTEVEGKVDGRQKFVELIGDTVKRKPQQWLQVVAV